MSTSALVGGKLHFSGCQAEAGEPESAGRKRAKELERGRNARMRNLDLFFIAAGGGLHIREAGEIKRGSLVFEDGLTCRSSRVKHAYYDLFGRTALPIRMAVASFLNLLGQECGDMS